MAVAFLRCSKGRVDSPPRRSISPMQPIDHVLLAYLKAEDESDAETQLEELIRVHAYPLVEIVIRSKQREALALRDRSAIGIHDVEDIKSEVILRLMRRLRELRRNQISDAPANLHSYIAVSAYNAFYDHLRRKYPARSRLKNKIRYVLTHQKGFALWAGQRGEWYCGYEAWKTSERRPCPAWRMQQLCDENGLFERAGSAYTLLPTHKTPQLLKALFDCTGAPVGFDDLISFLEILGPRSHGAGVSADRASTTDPEFQDSRPDFASRVEQRLYLEKLWTEIRELPLPQRRALLLNLRDPAG